MSQGGQKRVDPSFVQHLRDLDRQLDDEVLGAGAGARIGRALAEASAEPRGGLPRFVPLLSFAAGAAMVIAFFAWSGSRLRPSVDRAGLPETAVAQTSVGSFRIEGEHCQASAAQDAAVARGDCRFVAEHMSVQTWEPVTLSAHGETIRMHEGRAVFDVEHVGPSEPPVRVEVSHGAIEVLGTRFEVEQGAHGGRVDLFEGRIRFTGHDGTQVEILPGQRHRWGETQAAASPAANPPKQPSIGPAIEDEIQIDVDPEPATASRPAGRADKPLEKSPDTASQAAAIIERVGELRAAGRYREAAAMLEDALRRRWDRRTGQVLSYELGELLHRHLGDRAGACRHLAKHQRRYRSGLYSAAIETTRARLECDEG